MNTIMKNHTMVQRFIFIGICCSYASAFVLPSTFSLHGITSSSLDNNEGPSSSELFMSLQQQDPKFQDPFVVDYPVISRIAGMNWTGSCRYVGADLVPLSELELTGGVRYDINNGTIVTLSSFLTFPNGNTREVMMRGSRENNSDSPVIVLRSMEEEGGPIRMHLTELGDDTILINEVEEATGKTILTASLSITATPGKSGRMELVQVSHEIGEGTQSIIQGHQVWRLRAEGPVEFDDFTAW
uniref:Uncharacterized protein n=1 Tax=Attheya septentrionalis TaxID=420275 RepID=A0A7S2UNV2_9STRA|mmetsp:Transcript_4323/g.7735  ORF Transcript_4323/g.7735 Transcript_4323/m.7735 type:complete len:242 (+) Transcript_4323:58-783(+)